MISIALKVAEGNPGALRVCGELLKAGREDVLILMDLKGIRGCRVWLAFKDLGDQTIPTLIKTLEADDLEDRMTKLGYAPLD